MTGTRIRNRNDAVKRRTQPNWLIECIKLGVPLAALPKSPAHDAPYADKCRHTWKLRKLYEQRTGSKIERLTPPGYNAKFIAKRTATRFNSRSKIAGTKE